MQIPAQKCCKEHGKWTEHAANCCKYRGKYNGKWEVRTQNRCTYRGNGSFQLQNAANSMENGENRKSKKNFPNKKKIPKQFPTHIYIYYIYIYAVSKYPHDYYTMACSLIQKTYARLPTSSGRQPGYAILRRPGAGPGASVGQNAMENAP